MNRGGRSHDHGLPWFQGMEFVRNAHRVEIIMRLFGCFHEWYPLFFRGVVRIFEGF